MVGRMEGCVNWFLLREGDDGCVFGSVWNCCTAASRGRLVKGAVTMPAKRIGDKAVYNKKNLFRLFIRIVAGLVLVTLVVIVAVRVWIVPDVIRRKVERGLSKFCEGPVEIERVRTFRSGQVALEGIQFCDTARRPWLLIEKVKAVLANWPSFSPTVEEITINGLNLRLSAADGKFVLPPVRLPKRAGGPGAGPGIRKLTINQAAVTITDARSAETVYGDLTLSVVRMTSGDYEFTLNRITGESSELLLARGGVNLNSSDFDISFQMKHRFAKAEAALPLAALNVTGISAEGDLAGDLSITGCLKKPNEWQPKGTIRLRDWVVDANDALAWNGLNLDLEVGSSGFGFENLSISDSNGVQWLGADNVELALTDWPGPRPIVTGIELDAPRLRMIAAGPNKLKIPAWLPKRRSDRPQAGFLSLQELAIRDGAILVTDPNGKTAVLDKLWLAAEKQDDFYNIALSRRDADDSNAVSLKGTVNPDNSQIALSLHTDYVASRQEGAVLFARLGKPQYSAEGRVVADLTIAGRLNEPLGLQANGSVKLDKCALLFKEAMLASNLVTEAKIDGRRLDIESYEAAMCEGKVSGYFHADVNEGRQVTFRGRVLVVNVNFPQFSSVLTAKAKKAAQGTFTASYAFAGQRNGTRIFNGDGLIFFDDADVSILPAVPQMFASAEMSQYEPLKMSDVEATFTTMGPVVTIHSGHISNNFAAIEFEPDATIDLQARQIDGYVVVAPLSQIAGAIEGLPIINIFARLKDKLMRLHVKGDWSAPPGKLITKEPVKDLKESTIGFFQDVVKGGGQFGRGILNRLGGLFKTDENKSK